jgi:hypothetical protein
MARPPPSPLIKLLLLSMLICSVYADKFVGVGWCMNAENERPPYWGMYSERSLNRCLDACAETDTCLAVAFRKNDKYCTLHMDADENPGEDWSGPFNEEMTLNLNHTETNAIVIECWAPEPPHRKRKRRARKKKRVKRPEDEEYESLTEGQGPPEDLNPQPKGDQNRIVLDRPKRVPKKKKGESTAEGGAPAEPQQEQQAAQQTEQAAEQAEGTVRDEDEL